MMHLQVKKIPLWCLLCLAVDASAEGIINFNPYIGTAVLYDDNVFRFSTPALAQATFGDETTSDVIKQLNFGANANLRISRQLFSASANISDSTYDRFKLLDNTGKSYRLAWDWQFGNHVVGTLSIDEGESISGFTEIRSPVKNTKIIQRQLASANWNFHPDLTVFGSQENIKTNNQVSNFAGLDRKDTVRETGLRYVNKSNTQLGLSYRISETGFLNPGDQSKQKTLLFSAAWSLTPKTNISARLSSVDIDYKNGAQVNFTGFNQRWSIDHALSGKVNLNTSVYKEVQPVDDTQSIYSESTGFSFGPAWNISSKLSIRGGVNYEDREYIGGTILSFYNNRKDKATSGNIALSYLPTDKSLLLLQYQGENLQSNSTLQSYQFNSINFLARYNF